MKTTSFFIRVAICFLLSWVPLTEIENQIYSARMQLRGKAGVAPNLVILEVDPADFHTLKRRYSANDLDSRGEPWQTKPNAPTDRLEGLRDLFFWDPAVFREVLRRVLAKDPSLISITWSIPSEVADSLSDPGVELLARNRKVVWSTQFDSDGKYMRPPRVLATRDNFGFNNLIPDSDGVVRRSVLTRENRPSITRVAQQVLTGSASSDNPESSYLINYMGPSGSVQVCRLIDFLDGKSPGACDLKNRIVLLARDTERDSDLSTFRTPLGGMSRAEVIANELNTIVNRKPIYRAPLVIEGLLILAMILGGALYIIYYPVVISAISVVGTGVAVVIVLFQVIFQLFSFYIPSAHIIFSLLITYLVFTGYRLAFQENLQWRTLKQGQYLRELDQMKTNFLTLVSHDLKTPIAKIQAVVEILKREPGLTREQLLEHVESIDNSNQELRRYITSILNLSKIESKGVILNKKSNDINQIIQATLRRLRPLAANKKITLEESLEPLFSVECDEDLMRQVLTNLIDNAIKYSPENSKVIVRSREIEGFIQVDVEDFGPGIPKDQLPLMFRKFSRFMRPIKEKVKGSGLGLYLSKYFIELHGGSIRLKSVEGQGTTFTFTLPLNGSESESLLS